ncbi:MAG: hypothetical protein LBG67_03200 [Campylobacteraceae bacterium]|nr:hypothetical protein [Campylobacteraceae bacterium]
MRNIKSAFSEFTILTTKDFAFIKKLANKKKYSFFENQLIINDSYCLYFLLFFYLEGQKKWKIIRENEHHIPPTHNATGDPMCVYDCFSVVIPLLYPTDTNTNTKDIWRYRYDNPLIKSKLPLSEHFIFYFSKTVFDVLLGIPHEEKDINYKIHSQPILEEIDQYIYGKNFKAKRKIKTTEQDRLLTIQKILEIIRFEKNEKIKCKQKLIEHIRKIKQLIGHREHLNDIIKKLKY